MPSNGTDLLFISVLCYFIPIVYVYALNIFQKSSSQRGLGLPIGLLDMGFHLLTFWRLTTAIVVVPHR